MTVSSLAKLLAGLGAVLGVVLLLGTVAVLTQRLWLVLLVPVGSAVLLWASLRARRLPVRRALLIGSVALLLVGVPVDVSFERTGHPGVTLVPVIWGLPTRESIARAKAGEVALGGCIVPLGAARYVVRVSW